MPAMPSRRALLATAGAVAVVVLLVWWPWSRSADVQVPAAFAAIADAIHDGDPKGVLGRLHPRYDFAARWPEQLGRAEGELGGKSPRELALMGLRYLFLQQRSDPIAMAWEVHSISERADGTVEAVVTLRFSTPSGRMAMGPEGAVERKRFVLARDGWSAALLIVDHDPIPVR